MSGNGLIQIVECQGDNFLCNTDPGSMLISQANPYTIVPFGINPRSED